MGILRRDADVSKSWSWNNACIFALLYNDVNDYEVRVLCIHEKCIYISLVKLWDIFQYVY